MQGGIHRYLETFPDGGHFQGKNFVFDTRIAVAANDYAATTGTAPLLEELQAPTNDTGGDVGGGEAEVAGDIPPAVRGVDTVGENRPPYDPSMTALPLAISSCVLCVTGGGALH